MEGGDVGLDDDFMRQGDAGIGATIMGGNMFGPIRGPWGGDDWRGWWGDNNGIEAALERALDASGGDDVRIGGGAATVQQYLRAGLIDELHLVIVPILLGRGETRYEERSRRSAA